jgi:hypothetical protein
MVILHQPVSKLVQMVMQFLQDLSSQLCNRLLVEINKPFQLELLPLYLLLPLIDHNLLLSFTLHQTLPVRHLAREQLLVVQVSSVLSV